MRQPWPVIALCLLATAFGACLAHHTGPMPGEPEDGRWAEVDGVRVRYIDEGEGPVVVLLHGFASSLDTWAAVVPALTDTHRVVALDLKGFGWTGRPEGDYSPSAQADLVRGLIAQLGVDHFAVVAHSWGAGVALQLALDEPERVDRIALYDAWVYADQLPPSFVWARAPGVGEFLFGAFYRQRPEDKLAMAFHDPANIDQALVDAVVAAMDRPGTTAAALAAIRGQHYEELEALYPTLDIPTLLLWGRDDHVTPLQFAERLLHDLPDASLVTYPRCGHLPMVEAAARSTSDLAAFLRGDQ